MSRSNKELYRALIEDDQYLVVKEGEVYARMPKRGRPAKGRVYPLRRVDFNERSGLGRIKYKGVNLVTARAVWIKFNGEIEDWMNVGSKVSGSAKLDDLFLMTRPQKRSGAVGKSRGKYAEGCIGDRLHDGDWIRAIGLDIRAGKLDDNELSSIYGVTENTVVLIREEGFGTSAQSRFAYRQYNDTSQTLERMLELQERASHGVDKEPKYSWIFGGVVDTNSLGQVDEWGTDNE